MRLLLFEVSGPPVAVLEAEHRRAPVEAGRRRFQAECGGCECCCRFGRRSVAGCGAEVGSGASRDADAGDARRDEKMTMMMKEPVVAQPGATTGGGVFGPQVVKEAVAFQQPLVTAVQKAEFATAAGASGGLDGAVLSEDGSC